MVLILTVDEVSKKLGISKKTVYNTIKKAAQNGIVLTEVVVKAGVKNTQVFTTEGYAYICNIYPPIIEEQTVLDDQGDIFVNHLLEQLRQKDLQLAEKDRQISQLIEQSRNYQVLLRAEQERSLPAPKRGFIHRLFGRSSSDQ